jgi:hypothetical protein
VPDFAPFKDCPLFRAMAGSIAGSEKSQQLVRKELTRRRICVFLASGSSLGIGDGCTGKDAFISLRDCLMQSVCMQIRRYGSHVLLRGRR